jgi:20S proteasome alpha/beta subunit
MRECARDMMKRGSDNKSYVRMAANVTTLIGNYNRNGATAMGAGPYVAVYILEQ